MTPCHNVGAAIYENLLFQVGEVFYDTREVLYDNLSVFYDTCFRRGRFSMTLKYYLIAANLLNPKT